MTYPPPEQPYQPPAQQPQQPPVPVKTGANKVVVIILAIVLVLCLGCGGFGAYWFFKIKNKVEEVVDSIPTDFPTTNGGDAVAPGSVTHKVRYEVTGTGTVHMVWAEEEPRSTSARR
jgi:flagellar basal body-associated protein FliL